MTRTAALTEAVGGRLPEGPLLLLLLLLLLLSEPRARATAERGGLAEGRLRLLGERRSEGVRMRGKGKEVHLPEGEKGLPSS